uniref:RAD51D N-terminal domain-containing protein n=1 Tax=Podarcis muralis TaxID=64176 RepID=A0A670K1H3_PODMU
LYHFKQTWLPSMNHGSCRLLRALRVVKRLEDLVSSDLEEIAQKCSLSYKVSI